MSEETVAGLPRPPVDPGISVVIPALNEEDGVGQTIAAVRSAVAGMGRPVEIVIVDDGSRDRTRQVALDAGARVISHPQPSGYGKALRTGITAAAYDTIVISDADGTYPVEEIPRLVGLLDRYDMVVGARTGPLYIRKALLSPMRSTFLLLTNFVTGTWIPDPNSGLRTFRRSDVAPLLGRLPRGFSFTTTMTLLMTLAGKFIHYQPIAYRKRIGRSKVRIVRDALRVGQTLVEVVLCSNPLKLFLLLSLPPAVAGVVALALGSWAIGAVCLCSAAVIFALGMLSVVILYDRIPR